MKARDRTGVLPVAALYDEGWMLLDILTAARPNVRIEVLASFTALVEADSAFAFAVVGLREREQSWEHRLGRLVGSLSPLILVMEPTKPVLLNVSAFPGLIDRVVWASQLPRALSSRLRDLGLDDPFLRLADGLDRTVAPIVKEAIRKAAMSRPPPRTVEHLAFQMGVRPRTFRYHWRRSMPVGASDLLRWLKLLRAAEVGPSPSRAAAALGTDPRTLLRAAALLAGAAGPELPARTVVVSAFDSWWADAQRAHAKVLPGNVG